MPGDPMPDVSLVIPEPAQRGLVDRLAQFYAYDFSEINDLAFGADGRFGAHPCFDLIWSDPAYHARLIKQGSLIAGFAIIHEHAPEHYDMLQFFVRRGLRRRGIGRAAAIKTFDAFPGTWTVEQMAVHHDAQAFWRETIVQYTGGAFEESGEDPEQRFTAPPNKS